MTVYAYDHESRLINTYEYDSETYLNEYGADVYYDDSGRVSYTTVSYSYGIAYSKTEIISNSYSYNALSGNLERMSHSSNYVSGTIDPVYDNLGKTKSKVISFKVNNVASFYAELEYDYKASTLYESGLVSQVVSSIGQSSTGTLTTTTYNYTYDKNGNITQITDANGVIQNRYEYDDLGQLTREDNRAKNKSYVWTYDNAGNILSRKEYAFTTGTLGTATSTVNYTYGNTNWGDQLTKYGNSTITYDEIGNPIYMGGDTYAWKGRQLISRYDDYEFVNYTYNADGIRTSKEYGEYDYHQYRHEYTLNGTQIVKETVYYNEYGDSGFVEDYTLVYIYDETGSPIGMKYREPSYAGGVYDVFFFEKNLQGDIVSVYNSTGEKVLSYTYDAWGNFTQTYVGGTQAQIFTAQKNPFRYRGYYYDADTGFYYLQSRYYNPQWGRFLNADAYVSTGQSFLGYDMFAYCGNNPIMHVDPNGNSWIHTVLGWLNTIVGSSNPINKLVAAGSVIVAAAQGRWGDIKEDWNNGCFNPFNQDESVALNSKVFSFYKGETVIRHSFSESGSLQIFGTIFLTSEAKNNSKGVDVLNHEFGHGIQEKFLGGGYLLTVAIPSVAYYWLGSQLPRNYFSTPWERTADFFGGVDRQNYKNGSMAWGLAQMVFGPIVVPVYFIFGY